jgi:hypothetical protein
MRRASLFALSLVAGCGHRSVEPPATAPVPACAINGTWSIAWTPEPMVRETGWGLPRTLDITIAPGDTESAEAVDGGPGTTAAGFLQIDRDRCRVHAVYTMAIVFSDDMGNRDDELILDLAFQAGGAEATGRYRVEDTSEDPVIHADARVTGRVTRVPDLTEE